MEFPFVLRWVRNFFAKNGHHNTVVYIINLLYYTQVCDRSVGWSCRIHQLHLCRGLLPPINDCPGYDTKVSDGEPPVLELCGIWNTPSLPLLPDPLSPGVVVPIGQFLTEVPAVVGESVIYWASTETSIKRCTCVNKRKNSRSMLMWDNNITRCPGRLESVGDRMPVWEQLADWGLCGPQWPMVEQPSQDEKEVLLWSKKNLESI